MAVVDVTWGCGYLQAQQGEMYKKALSPDLELFVTAEIPVGLLIQVSTARGFSSMAVSG